MYEKGQYIVCGVNGVCVVQDITTLTLDGVDKNRKYYLLKPVFSNGSTVYKPIDFEDNLRPALNREEALELIESVSSIGTLEIDSEKNLEKIYKDAIHSCDPKLLISLIKTILLRKEKRLLKGFKITALDSRYFKQAEDSLYGELSVALDVPKNEMRAMILSKCDSN